MWVVDRLRRPSDDQQPGDPAASGRTLVRYCVALHRSCRESSNSSGARQVGGTCVEVAVVGRRIVLDVGIPMGKRTRSRS